MIDFVRIFTVEQRIFMIENCFLRFVRQLLAAELVEGIRLHAYRRQVGTPGELPLHLRHVVLLEKTFRLVWRSPTSNRTPAKLILLRERIQNLILLRERIQIIFNDF